MNSKGKITVCEIISIAGFLLMSCSFLLMPSVDNSNGVSTFGMIVGLLFWIGLLTGIVMQIVAVGMSKGKRGKYRIGLFSFMKNIYGMIADIMVVVSIVVFIIGMIITHKSGYICYVAIALFTFSISMHCVCNGRVFRYILSR